MLLLLEWSHSRSGLEWGSTDQGGHCLCQCAICAVFDCWSAVVYQCSDMRQLVPDIPAEYLLSVLTTWDEGYEQRSCALLQLLTHAKANECLVDACTKVCMYRGVSCALVLFAGVRYCPA